MSYTIRKTDGTNLVVVPENEIITDAIPLSLIGRGSIVYGEHHSENFVKLLENFARETPPANPLEGMLWYDRANGTMNMRSGGEWRDISRSSLGGNGSGVLSLDIGNDSILVFAAGDKVIAILSPVDIANANLPVSVAILSQVLPLRSRFPLGIQAGYNLADDPNEYIFNGRVLRADGSTFAGGGTPFAASTFADLGASSVALSISNNKIIAAHSETAIPNSSLPTNFTINGITMPFRAVFPNGLIAGMTIGSNYAIGIGGSTISGANNGVTIATVQSLVAGEATARASAITQLETDVSETYATAASVTNLESAFISGTGQSSVSEAVDFIITAATDGTANAEATTQLRSEVTNAITGAASFADALQRINTTVSSDFAEASDLNQLSAEIRTGLGVTSVAQIDQRLTTIVNQSSANAQSLSAIESSFQSNTGETTTAAAINRIWAEATATGSVAGWGVNVNADGQIAGLQLLANSATQTSDIIVNAEQFKFYHPSTPTISPFRISENRVYIDNLVIESGSIGTDKLTTLYVTEEVYRGTTLTLPSNNAPISGLVISTGEVQKGTKIVILFHANVFGSDGGGMWGTIRRSDGRYLTGRAEFGCPDEGGSSQGWSWSDTIPANGTYTYQVWADEFGTCRLKNAHLIGIVQKQFNGTAADTASNTSPIEDPIIADGASDFSGSGSSTAGTSGANFEGGGACVVGSSYFPDGSMVRDVRIGDELTVLDYKNMDNTLSSSVKDFRHVQNQPCIKLTSKSGIWVECSASTPLTMKNGKVVYGRDILGKEMAVQDSQGFRWEEITSITYTGNKDVVLISADEQTYAAGGEKGKMIFTHNSNVVKL